MTKPGSTPDVAPAGHPYRVEIDAERQGWHELVESMLGVGGGPPGQVARRQRPLTGGYYVIPSADRLAAFSG